MFNKAQRYLRYLTLFWLALLPAMGFGVEVEIAYIQFVPERGPLLSNVIPEPEDSGLRGAELGLKDNNTSGRFLNHSYHLESRSVDSADAAVTAFTELQAAGIQLFILRVPAETLARLTSLAGDDTLLFNAGAKDDSLRTITCLAQVMHVIPSYAMLTDALGQWLKQRRWDDVFLLTGPTADDIAWADAFRRTAQRFGLNIVEDKLWTFAADLRRSASKELPLFTQASDYEVVVVADVFGDFGEYVPFNTWLPRPVVGTQGMTPLAWHWVVESWGAAQLQNRFRELAKRNMTSEDYAAWTAMRSIDAAVTDLSTAAASDIRSFLFSDRFQLAAFKGRKLTFRNWNGQLRQPIPLAHPQGLVAQAPFEQFLHPNSQMDTLGFDKPESQCRVSE